jgi:lipoprotein LprG
MRQITLRSQLLLAAIVMLLAGCAIGGSPAPTPVPTPVPTPTPTPAEISAQVGKATQASQSVHFDIALSGKPVFVDDSKLFAINSIVGDLKRPDGVLATLKVGGAAGISEVKSVSLAGKQYITNPITRAWQCLPPGTTFDPVVLFDPTKGFEFLLQKGFEDVSLVGTEDIAGRSSYHLRGTMSSAALKAISTNLLGAGPVKVDLWADLATKRASQIVLVDVETDPAKPTTWTIKFSDYDKTVDVQAPPGAKC